MTTQREEFRKWFNEWDVSRGVSTYTEERMAEAWNAALSQPNEPVAEFKQFGKSGLQGSYCQFVFNPKFVKNCKEGDKVYSAPPKLEAKVNAWIESSKRWEKDCLKQLALKNEAIAQIAELRAKCEKMREALEYYKDAISIDDSECECGRGTQTLDDGYKAHEALEECK